MRSKWPNAARSEMLEAYYGLLTTMDDDPAAAEQQINTCLEALEVYPLDSQLLCGMGSYLLRSRRLDLAARSYEMAVLHGKVDPSIWHLADLADVAVTCWSLVLQLMSDTKRAEAVLKQAVADRPDSLRLRRQLIELYVKAGRERDAIAQCQLLPEDCRLAGTNAHRGPWAPGWWRRKKRPPRWAAATRVSGRMPRPACAFAGWRRPIWPWRTWPGWTWSSSNGNATSQATWKLPRFVRPPCSERRQAFGRTTRRVDGAARAGLPIEPPKITSPSASPRI